MIKSFIFIFSLLSFIISYETIQFIENANLTFLSSGNSTYKVNFDNLSPNFFFNITVKSESQYNQYITYSNTDEYCKNERKQLAMNPHEDVNLLIPSTQINTNFNYFFFCVLCQIKDNNCKYKTTVEGVIEPILDLTKQYNFYISKENKILEFKLRNAPENTEVIIWVKGKNSPKSYITIDDSNKELKTFSNGDIYLINDNSTNKDNYNLKIITEEGDYITIGSDIIKDKKGKKLLINDLEYFGFLKRGKLDEICYPLEKNDNMKDKNDAFYITGVVYTKIAKTYFKDEKGKTNFSDRLITYGNILETVFNDDIKEHNYFCVSFVKNDSEYNIDEVVFSIQITSHKYINYNQFLYPPLIPGLIYPYVLKKGEIAVFSGMNSNKDSKKISFNMKSIVGFPKMYFDTCNNYPNCEYNEDNLRKLITAIHSNKMTNFNFYKEYTSEEINPISSFQPLLIVHCVEGLLIKNGAELCNFEASIFTEKDHIVLKESETYSQFILKGEKDLYTISYEGYKNINKIFLDLIVFTGDIILELDTDVEAYKFFLSNKIFYTITINNNDLSDKIINFHVKAEKNSFYIVQYQLIFENEQKYINYLESGFNYIESIEPNSKNNYKYMKIYNSKTYLKLPLIINFYSENCKLNISREIIQNGKSEIKYIITNHNYGQEIVDENDPNYFYETYTYRIEAINDDISQYNNKLCMVYMSGLELTENSEYYPKETEQEISLSEGVPHIYNFNKNNKIIKYAYHVADKSDSILINFYLIDKTDYNVVIFIEDNSYNFYTNRNQQFFIDKNDLEFPCLDKQVCNVRIYIILQEDINNSRLETTIRQVSGGPVYLKKNTSKKDVLINNYYKYYYFDIGKNENGFISIDYKRKGGNIYGKIVKIGEKESNNPDWRGLYNFPKEKNLTYEPYLKKLIIKEEDTNKCDNGCFVLIAIQCLNSESENLDIQRFTITSRINQPNLVNYNDIPIIDILLNDFIFGNISPSKNGELNYDFYKLSLRYDSNEIYIDWQAELPNLYIRIGDERATSNNYHFYFENKGYDTVYKITKDEILEKCKTYNIALKNENSIKDLIINIGISTNKADSLFTSVYALRIYLPHYIIDYDGDLFQLEIYHIRTNQKVQCRPNSISDLLFCYFAVVFDKSDIYRSLTVYLQSRNPKVKNVYYYARMVDSQNVETNNITWLVDNFPTDDNSEYIYENSKIPFIYIPEIPMDSSLLIEVDAEEDDIIELISYIDYNSKEIIPNPSSPQLFSIKKDEIILSFIHTDSYIFNIKSIYGVGKIHWEPEEKNIFYLQGKNSRLSLTSLEKNNDEITSKLIVSSDSNEYYISNDLPKFVFYVTYYPRNNYKFGQIEIGESVEFRYRDEKNFPLYFYSKFDDIDYDLNIFINFYDMEIINKNNEDTTIVNSEFDFNYNISNQLSILTASNDLNFSKKGFYDSSIKVAQIYISKDEIKNYNLNDNENEKVFPSLFLKIEKSKNLLNNEYKLGTMKILINKENSDEIIIENIYHYGKIINKDDINSYKLKIDKLTEYMRIQFSSNNKNIIFSINQEIGEKTNSTDINYITKYERGKLFITFKKPKDIDYIYLNIFSKNEIIDKNINNYVFKYINGEKDKFKEYPILSNKTTIKYDRNGNNTNLTISFSKIEKINIDIIYTLKIVPANNSFEDEIKDTIAITESNCFVKQIKNLKDNNGVITLNTLIKEEEIGYIEIIALIKDGSNIEYVAYEPIILYEKEEEEEEGKYLEVIIVFSVVILIMSIAIFGSFWYINKKYMKLKKNIDKISYKESRSEEKRETSENLFLDEENKALY